MATLHGDVAGTKNSNILENKQTMEDSHTEPLPMLEVFPLNQIADFWGSEQQRP